MPRPPNVLLLFADQHHAGVLSCAGHGQVATPHLDRLAAEGVRFDSAWCQDGICLPSRASLMTGLHPRTLGVFDNTESPWLPAVAIPLAQRLRAAGWRTAAFGKRHLPTVLDRGWDESATTMPQPFDVSQERYFEWIVKEGHGDAWQADWDAEHGDRLGRRSGPLMCGVSHLPETHTMEAWTAQRTCAFLRRQRGADRPFFCWSSFYRPHQPYTPLPRWLDRHPEEAVVLPASLREDPANLPPLLRAWREGGWLAKAAADERIHRQYVACYLALVEEVDHHVGAVLRCLTETGCAEDTIVIYTSDHGDFVAEHGMAEKCALGHNVYAATLRVPLIIRWPGRARAGAVRDDLVELTDLAPTILAACGLPAEGLPGLDLAPALAGGPPLPRTVAFSENWSQVAAIGRRCTLGVWRPCPFPDRDWRAWGDQLFDRADDPLEMRNRRGDPTLAAEESALRTALADWERATPAVATERLAAALAAPSG